MGRWGDGETFGEIPINNFYEQDLAFRSHKQYCLLSLAFIQRHYFLLDKDVQSSPMNKLN